MWVNFGYLQRHIVTRFSSDGSWEGTITTARDFLPTSWPSFDDNSSHGWPCSLLNCEELCHYRLPVSMLEGGEEEGGVWWREEEGLFCVSWQLGHPLTYLFNDTRRLQGRSTTLEPLLFCFSSEQGLVHL